MSAPEKPVKQDIPDAEFEEGEKHDVKPKVERITVIREGEEPEEKMTAELRFHRRTKHLLLVEWTQDENGDFDVYISDADVN